MTQPAPSLWQRVRQPGPWVAIAHVSLGACCTEGLPHRLPRSPWCSRTAAQGRPTMTFYPLWCRIGHGLWWEGTGRSLCQIPWGPWAKGYKGQRCKGPAQPLRAPVSDTSGGRELRTPEMKTLFLTLSLVAALQAQDAPASGAETPDVRLREGRAGRGLRKGQTHSSWGQALALPRGNGWTEARGPRVGWRSGGGAGHLLGWGNLGNASSPGGGQASGAAQCDGGRPEP